MATHMQAIESQWKIEWASNESAPHAIIITDPNQIAKTLRRLQKQGILKVQMTEIRTCTAMPGLRYTESSELDLSDAVVKAQPSTQQHPSLIHQDAGLDVSATKTETGLVMTFDFHGQEAQGKIVLEETAYGLYVMCPAISTEIPLGHIDLYYASPEATDAGVSGPPVRLEFFSPAQTEDPLGSARCYPDGTTRVMFERDVRQAITTDSNGNEVIEYGYDND